MKELYLAHKKYINKIKERIIFLEQESIVKEYISAKKEFEKANRKFKIQKEKYYKNSFFSELIVLVNELFKELNIQNEEKVLIYADNYIEVRDDNFILTNEKSFIPIFDLISKYIDWENDWELTTKFTLESIAIRKVDNTFSIGYLDEDGYLYAFVRYPSLKISAKLKTDLEELENE